MIQNEKRIDINEYANSMFRFEFLPEDWITMCESYVKMLFGDKIVGKVIVDYAFGRGNWSLAFLRAGASRVVAIDASIDNVIRFKEYCKKNVINEIEIIHGNLLTDRINAKGDIIWLYGILPCISDLHLFINKIKKIIKNEDSLLYIYSYNSNSLRHFTVERCRKFVKYSSEEEFLQDSMLFLRSARLRAKDDLTAPSISWMSATELQSHLRKCGIYVMRCDPPFEEFLNGVSPEEFYPNQFLCSLREDKEIKVKEQEIRYKDEIGILHEMANFVFSEFKPLDEKKKIAIGLFNTHFAYRNKNGEATNILIEILLYFVDILLKDKITRNKEFSTNITNYLNLCIASAAGIERGYYKTLIGENCLTKYLCMNRIRI